MELQTHNATVKRQTPPAGGGVYGALSDLQQLKTDVLA